MTPETIAHVGVAQLAAALEDGSLTASTLIKACLQRAEALNPTCHAYIEMTADKALARAAVLDRGPRQGLLQGIPFGVKDNIDVAGVPTTAGSGVLQGNVATEDAHLVALLQAAGAIATGKLNLHEFAYGATGENPLYGTPPNAYDPARMAGGSSSGSAAALAWGLLPMAFGTDTGGSVRAPAALNGLVGLKPTFGRVSVRGTVPYCWSLDHMGTMARSVEDTALILQVIAGPDAKDPSAAQVPVGDYLGAVQADRDLSGVTIGVPRAFFFEHVDPEILAATERAMRYLESRGAVLRDVSLTDMTHTRTVSLTIQMPEALSYHMPLLEERGGLYGDDFRAGLALGQNLLAEQYVRAKRMMTLYREEVSGVFESVDALITPATPAIAPELGAVTVLTAGLSEPAGNAITRFTSFFNMTGHPAITVPSGLHSKGLPMGIQLVGRHFDEAGLLRIANVIDRNPDFNVPPAQI